MKRILCTICLMSLVSMSGCSTLVTGKYQNIPVTSSPTGIEVKTGDMFIITPGSFDLRRNKTHYLVAEYEGQWQEKELTHGLQGWFLGNLIFWPGAIVDLASGTSDELSPKKVHFDFYEQGKKSDGYWTKEEWEKEWEREKKERGN